MLHLVQHKRAVVLWHRLGPADHTGVLAPPASVEPLVVLRFASRFVSRLATPSVSGQGRGRLRGPCRLGR